MSGGNGGTQARNSEKKRKIPIKKKKNTNNVESF
jgi:hypothetical protein